LEVAEMSGTTMAVGAERRAGEAVPTRWAALGFIGLAQLMVALDATVVNVALPSAQHALRFTDADRQWVTTAYTLVFAGLVLLGGKIADLVGRRRTFLLGLIGFAGASALAGAANGIGMLAGARALQGVFAALLAPTTLSLLAVMFTDARERAKAFAVFGAIAGSGAAVGLVLGGTLTEYLDWRWCLYVNIAVAVIAAAGGFALLPNLPGHGRQRLDILGALLASGGLVALVYGCTEAVGRGWGSPVVLGLLGAAATLIGAFGWWQTRAEAPLLPLRILRNRDRAGAYLAMGLGLAGMLGLLLFLTYYLQVVLHYSPIRAGLAFLPLSAAVQLGAAGIGSRLSPKVRPRALIVPGLLAAAAAMLLLTQLTPESGYVSLVLPAEVILGVGMGCVFVPAMTIATSTVEPRDAGIASGVVNTAQQAGGSIGTAFLNTIAVSATAGYLAAGPTHALVHGYTVAAGWAAVILTVAAVLSAVLVTRRNS
jgi:EmrB/QacA subfamily drug resistance transporter